ncbi:uncharacterized protein K489DRAFT_378347 [Dissoconium aciculare CBS 342.82]|uniref:UBX domain-containing protein n=1 Tax=Dissoconium aciculare CBS 342.82 TaxID=1314786 RepID=A0A6J3M7D0_9PEZI|nr:uncharacterized protein K489DRAFT_378347 [Dissoconium aciculare CBS 342.82]KAF1823971.1 hypothetical protein K489DRAFT_378347 [Dissoconium aciculare CBS 342.82]
MDEQVSTFCAFTSGTPEQAQRYLQLTDGNVEQAVELFFSSPDLGNTTAPTTTTTTNTQAAQREPTQSSRPVRGGRDAPINIDDEDEDMDDFNEDGGDDDLEELGSRPIPTRSGPSVEDDEAMARRLQEEMYGGGGGGAHGGDDVRAPMARTTETLIGPGSGDWRDDPDQMNAAIAQQLMARNRPRNQAPGIFNQQQTSSIWNTPDDANTSEARRQALSSATGGASDATPKANHLAELFRPPFDLISPLSLSDARDEGKETEKWILVNVQDPSIFDCQVLNRDIWKKPEIRDTVKEHFIFLQFAKTDPRGQEYINYYFSNMRDSDDAYPHIGIVDPRTGEQVKTWSGSPSPKPADFLMEILEFLDRYSLKMEKKNPVQAKRKQARKDVAAMSEEEMLEMALQNSLTKGATNSTFKEDDPDALTKADQEDGKSTSQAGPSTDTAATKETSSSATEPVDTPFSRISASNPHTEPTSTNPQETTRIQFRHSGGRVVRRFSLTDPVRRIYEWLKAEPLDDSAGKDFELISMGKNLIESLDTTIADAQLKNGTVMVEFVDAD